MGEEEYKKEMDDIKKQAWKFLAIIFGGIISIILIAIISKTIEIIIISAAIILVVITFYVINTLSRNFKKKS